MSTKKSLADTRLFIDLFDAHVIKVGNFRLRLGEKEPYRYVVTPFLIDVRVLVSYPKLLKDVTKVYQKALSHIEFDRMAAIPYAALPIVSAVSMMNERPWIYLRKETKSYGTQKAIEGEFFQGEKVVLIDDTLTSGISALVAVEALKRVGLVVNDIVLLIDRGEIGTTRLTKQGLHVTSLYHVNEIFPVLFSLGKISKAQYIRIQKAHVQLKLQVVRDGDDDKPHFISADGLPVGAKIR